MRTIRVNLSPSGIDKAIEEMKAYKKRLKKKCKEFEMAVAEAMLQQAQLGFASAYHNDLVHGGKQFEYIPMHIETDDKATYVVAEGVGAVMIEFGAGIHHNFGKSFLWKSRHPWGMELQATIGSYRDRAFTPSQGANEMWNSPVGLTYGTEAQYPLFYAWLNTVDDLENIAKGVFFDL